MGQSEVYKCLKPHSFNFADNCGETPIYRAAWHGHTDIVNILAPLTDNPNVPNNYGDTPIHRAAYNGHTEIVKILAPFTDNSNTSDASDEVGYDLNY